VIFVYCHISVSRSGNSGGQDVGRLIDGYYRVGGGKGVGGKLSSNCDPCGQGIFALIFRQ